MPISFSRSLYISVLGLCIFLVGSLFAGMSLYSVYKDCDPWTAGLVSAPDQVRRADEHMRVAAVGILTQRTHLPSFQDNKKQRGLVMPLLCCCYFFVNICLLILCINHCPPPRLYSWCRTWWWTSWHPPLAFPDYFLRQCVAAASGSYPTLNFATSDL